MVSDHLCGPVASPSAQDRSPSDYCPPVSGLCHCTPGSRPRGGTPKARRYARARAARTLSMGPVTPPRVLLVAALVCIMRTCSGHILTSFARLQVVLGVQECAAGWRDRRVVTLGA